MTVLRSVDDTLANVAMNTQRPRTASRRATTSRFSVHHWKPLAYQALLVLAVGLVVWYLVSNTMANLQARNITTGFAFLGDEAGFAIGESAIAYTPNDTYARALWVGVLNTLRVSAVGIVAATLLGTLLGIARLSANWLVSGVARSYIELMRNVPLLLHLLFWYALITESTPGPRQALHLFPGVYLSNRGLSLPWIQGEGAGLIGMALLVSLLLWVANRVWAGKRREVGLGPVLPAGMVALVAACVPVVACLWAAGSLEWQVPELKGFNFRGGVTLSPEFAALLIGLVLYTSAFVAEVVRSGIQAIGKGQWEAGSALGLSSGQVLRLIVMPQALRVIVPPMTSQYLNLTKNSSLAVAIGYPDIVSIANTTLNQTGQAIEGVMIIMAAYLTVSLSISLLMNWYNRHVALVER